MTACSSPTTGSSRRSSLPVPRPMRSRSPSTRLESDWSPAPCWIRKGIASRSHPAEVEDRDEVRRDHHQQGDRKRHVEVEPGVEQVAEALLGDQARGELAVLAGEHQQLAQLLLLGRPHPPQLRRPGGALALGPATLCPGAAPREQPPAPQRPPPRPREPAPADLLAGRP